MKGRKLDLSELSELIKETPVSQARLIKQAKAIKELQIALIQAFKHKRPYVIPIPRKTNIIRFGLISDTHFGSLYQRTDALTKFYERCWLEDVKLILHAGDVIDGWRVYRGQEFELHPHARSWNEQVTMFADLAPRFKGVETIFITGNHDQSFTKLIGIVVGDELQWVRPDWKHIGADIADVILKAHNGRPIKIRLVHPGDKGSAYALSYRIQKHIESIPGGQKPDIIAIGHYHKSLFIPEYRNVAAFSPGCFQSQTPFMARSANAAHIGGWIVSVVTGEKKHLTSRIKAEFISFYEEQK